MRNHYAIARFDDLGRLVALKVRIDDTMYIATPHDDGGRSREIFVNIDTAYAVGQKAVPSSNERGALLDTEIRKLKKRYSR